MGLRGWVERSGVVQPGLDLSVLVPGKGPEEERLAGELEGLPRLLLLLLRVGEDGRGVLRAKVVALVVESGGVVEGEEELGKLQIVDLA